MTKINLGKTKHRTLRSTSARTIGLVVAPVVAASLLRPRSTRRRRRGRTSAWPRSGSPADGHPRTQRDDFAPALRGQRADSQGRRLVPPFGELRDRRRDDRRRVTAFVRYRSRSGTPATVVGRLLCSAGDRHRRRGAITRRQSDRRPQQPLEDEISRERTRLTSALRCLLAPDRVHGSEPRGVRPIVGAVRLQGTRLAVPDTRTADAEHRRRARRTGAE